METYHDVNGARLSVADSVRRLPQGVPGRVLGFDDERGAVLVEWPHITDLVNEQELERIAPPSEPLPILETWRTGSPNVVWEVLGKWQDHDVEIWTCRVLTSSKSQGEIGDCYAPYIRLAAQKDEHQSQ